MSDATPHLGLPLIAAAQAQKHVTHNEALGLLDALVQLACLDKDLSAPPASPGEGDRYLVAAGNPSGAWAGLSGQVVRFSDGVWTGAVPRPGWFAYVIDEADLYIFDGTAWTSFRRAITQIELTSRLGVNTTPDATNRLAVKSDAALLSFDDITPGSGDMRVAVNKQAAARDAALVFQTGYAARALLGTLGGDDFSLKVSGDGATFSTVLAASAATGGIDFASAETVLAAAATTDLGATGTRRVLVTGAAAITSFGASANRERFVRFSGTATLTHDATRLIVPGRANILTAADDTCIASSDAAGNWRVRHYQRADGTPLVGGGVASVAGRTGTVTLAVADVPGAAPLASPALTGTPTAPNPAAGTNTAQVATTSFVAASFVTYAYAVATYAAIASPTLAGTPTAPTPAAKDNSTRLATTAYVDRGDAAGLARTQVNDAAYTILASDRTVAVIALSAARTLTLPAASAYPQGATLLVMDESGACSATNTITLARSGTSDTVNGGAATAIASAYGYLALASNGANKWTVVDAAAPVSSVAGRTGAVALAVADVAGAAPLASPALTGTPTAPTPAAGTNTTQVATTAFVASAVAAGGGSSGVPTTRQVLGAGLATGGGDLSADRTLTVPKAAPADVAAGTDDSKALTAYSVAAALAAKAPLASPALTGTPTVPTAAAGTSTTQAASTAFVAASFLTSAGAAATYAPLASPVLTGTPAAPTAAVDTATTQLASTAFVIGQASAAAPLMDGTAAIGTTTRFARADHVHPTDTSRVPTSRQVVAGSGLAGGGALSGDVALALGTVPTLTLLANLTASSSVPTGSPLSAILDATVGGGRGTLLVRTATAWAPLAVGASGYTLQSNGTDPVYAPTSPATGSVRYDTGQSLTAAQQAQVRSNVGAAESGANSTITALAGLTTPLSVAQGGTGATSVSAARTSLGAAASGANSDLTSISGLTTALTIGQGGTGATNAAAARSGLGAAASGANGDITALTGLTTALGVAQGGTGQTSASAALAALGGAPLASPALTGTPTLPTAAVDTNTMQGASTAFVIGQAATATPLVDGAAAAGTATRFARADHVHPTDTTRAPLASPNFTGTPTAPTPAAGTNSTQVATTAFVTSAVAAAGGSGTGTSLAGFRRRTRNGAFAVNQRGVSGTVTLAAGAYGHDGWKAGSSGCTYTFSAAASGDVTLTITAGTLLQVMEGALYTPEGGAYVLSWTGTATARVYQGSASGSYAAAPVAATGLTGGTNTVVEFGTGTLGLVQFEPGTAATAFERRDDELRRCQRYYETGQTYIYGQSYGAGASLSAPARLVPKAFSPNVGLSGIAASNMNAPSAAVTSLQDVLFYATSTAQSGTAYYQFNWTASAEL